MSCSDATSISRAASSKTGGSPAAPSGAQALECALLERANRTMSASMRSTVREAWRAGARGDPRLRGARHAV